MSRDCGRVGRGSEGGRRAGLGEGRTSHALAALGAVAITLLLGGCSQVAALAPVGGDGLAEVRYGAIDVLLAEGVDVLEAPVCVAGAAPTRGGATAADADGAGTASGATPATAADVNGADAASGATPTAAADAGTTPVTCSGTTMSGAAITAISSTAVDATLTVRVGDDELYSGPLWTVLDEAARP